MPMGTFVSHGMMRGRAGSIVKRNIFLQTRWRIGVHRGAGTWLIEFSRYFMASGATRQSKTLMVDRVDPGESQWIPLYWRIITALLWPSLATSGGK